MDELEFKRLEEDLLKKATKIENVNLLFLDLSSQATGYSIANCNFSQKSANFTDAGVIWFNNEWDHQEKYHYLYRAITTYFDIVKHIDYCVAEAYKINTKRLMGCQVSAEMHGSLMSSLAEVGTKYTSLHAQSWRKQLNIHAIKDSKGRRNFKEPTKQKILTLVDVPEEITSNITNNKRQTSSDLYDSLGLGIGYLKQLNFKTITFNNIQFQSHVGAIE
jgi:Holliday junction resolvasome RuvABC endonuclease subunit